MLALQDLKLMVHTLQSVKIIWRKQRAASTDRSHLISRGADVNKMETDVVQQGAVLAL